MGDAGVSRGWVVGNFVKPEFLHCDVVGCGDRCSWRFGDIEMCAYRFGYTLASMTGIMGGNV